MYAKQNALWLSMYIQLHSPIRAALLRFWRFARIEEKEKREMKERRQRREGNKEKPPGKGVGII